MSPSLPDLSESLPSEKIPRKSSPRGYTLNPESSFNVPKRIVVCCDGTWQDGIACKAPLQYTNILKIARAVNSQDLRSKVPIPQIVFYQAGVGTNSLFLMDCLDGAVGTSLRDKVEEAYAFIASNYQPSDEGAIGILDRKDMSQFAKIFDAFQERAHTDDEKKKQELNQFLAPYTDPQSRGHIRADIDSDKFTIKFIGVFDTVGALGLPRELRLRGKSRSLFGFPNKKLGEHIQYAYQALAIDETRKDFVAAKFEQSDEGRARGQVLKQVWFSGSHSDIGGGYQAHDLSDLTLMWMASHFEPFLSLDLDYLLCHLPQPVDSWGEQPPHDSRTGVFTLALTSPRKFPSLGSSGWPTHEYIHPSVLHQKQLPHAIRELLHYNSDILCQLQPLEAQAKEYWHKHPRQHKAKAIAEDAGRTSIFGLRSLIQAIVHFNIKLAHLLVKLKQKLD
ncbi:hypothetical protein Clacol_009075 [Clathrus columnatus]|uniref:T6SS Phospholipase effector Tle1-like catalytic domain-containing protein n=1 Tax=Clathrus columnatus TaxID=1419009 RepID=A0AAV5AJI9_9AGAM|nr:hypothetical protein Clacol_009075 [Clathrus columnatus]